MSMLVLGAPWLSVLFVVSLEGRPVRFGVPVPASAVAQGLSLRGPGAMQWRRLPVGGADADPVWVEIAIVGGPGQVRICSPGVQATAGRGPAFVRDEQELVLGNGRERRIAWQWCDGSVDTWVRTEFTAPTVVGGEAYAVGEARTVWSEGAERRADPVAALPRRLWQSVGLLPPSGRSVRGVREQLARALDRLTELPGARGAGDFLRSGEVVTNLEFDTTLALVHCALGLPNTGALVRAGRCARHLCDRDLDLHTGLPFPHGPDHRTGLPTPGHAWLQGLLFVGLLTADDGLVRTAQNLGRAIAASPPMGEGQQERARDYGWPLLELEALIAVDSDDRVARAADRLAASIARRYDAAARTFRFGEGEVGEGVYFERGWITGGIVLPALRRHLQRRPDARLSARVHDVQQALLDQIGRARPGLPTHWRTAGGKTFAEHRAVHAPEAMLLLEAFAPGDLQRLLRRDRIQDAVTEVPLLDDPDLPTTFSMVARCAWVWR